MYLFLDKEFEFVKLSSVFRKKFTKSLDRAFRQMEYKLAMRYVSGFWSYSLLHQSSVFLCS